MEDETGRKPQRSLMGNQLGYAFQNRKLLPMSNTRGQMQGQPQNIRTVQGCKKVIKHVFSPAAVCQQLCMRSLRSSLMRVGCYLEVCIPSSGHTWSGCIFPCMWTEREGEMTFLPCHLDDNTLEFIPAGEQPLAHFVSAFYLLSSFLPGWDGCNTILFPVVTVHNCFVLLQVGVQEQGEE